jgi:PPOX class probable F420-dependent enzyme
MFDTGSENDAYALTRLDKERVAWLTTVTADGQPQTTPIWYIRDGSGLLFYSDNRSKRLANIAVNPHVSFHLRTDELAHDIVVIEGTARIDTAAPTMPNHAGYCARYADLIAAWFESPEKMSEQYSVPVRITPAHARVQRP